jgi:D-alanyl-D-alanine-carboxypeptidase/D-alanyl-D-alanine-endopeptidase
MALLVEGYREFLEWWQTRPRWLAGPAEHDSGEPFREEPQIDVTETVDGILDRHADKHVGVVVGLSWRGRTWTVGRGRIRAGHPAPPDKDTIFEIGSVTKLFTALLLADMAEEGVVRLEDPVQRYLPVGVELPVRGRAITLLDLATHTSGLPRLPKGLLRLSLRRRDNPYAGFTFEDLEGAIGGAKLKRPPGEKLGYSNFGFGLLGHVLALRAGTSYEQLVRERIANPIGLDDTSIWIAPDARARFADGHNRRGRPVPHWDLPALAGAGALRSTISNLLRFVELQLREPTTRLALAARATHETRARCGKLAQSLGWVSLPLRGTERRMFWHNGGTGGFRSFVGFVGEARAAVVVLSNSSRSVDAIGFRVLEATAGSAPLHADRVPDRLELEERRDLVQ